MEIFTKVKELLAEKTDHIIYLSKMLTASQSLNKTLLSAVSDTIPRGEMMNYDDKNLLQKETKDICISIDNEVKYLQKMETEQMKREQLREIENDSFPHTMADVTDNN